MRNHFYQTLYVFLSILTVLQIQAFFSTGLRFTEGALKMSSSDEEKVSLNNQIKEALEAHKSGNIESALTLYDKIIRETSGELSSTLNSNVGAIHLQRGDYEQAHFSFSRAVEACPTNAQAHFNIAVILTTKLNKQGRAIKHCGKAIELDPNMHKAYHLMGNILQTIGRPDDADRYFTQAEEIARALALTSQGTGAAVNHEADEADGWGTLAVANARMGDTLSASHNGEVLSMLCVSERPRVFRVKALLSPTECDHIRSHLSKK